MQVGESVVGSVISALPATLTALRTAPQSRVFRSGYDIDASELRRTDMAVLVLERLTAIGGGIRLLEVFNFCTDQWVDVLVLTCPNLASLDLGCVVVGVVF